MVPSVSLSRAVSRGGERERQRQPVAVQRQEDPQQVELRRLLEVVSELRDQREALRGQLAKQEKQLEHHIAEKAALTGRLRQLEALRIGDMDLISKLRKEGGALKEANTQLTLERDRLQATLQSQRAHAAPEAVDPLAALREEDDSDLRRAALALAETCQGAGVARLVVVGGSPKYHQQLQGLLGEALSLRLIDGQERRILKQARADVEWADVVLIWGGTLLDHKLSALYQGKHVRVVSHRGLAGMLQLAAEVVVQVRASASASA